MREPVGENPLDQAVKRLDKALSQLEQRLSKGGGGAGELFAQGDAKLAAQLDQARAREKELEAAGAEASAALGRAIAEIKSALHSAPAEETQEA
ncbi:DUF4164 family protein [Phenylobacterium sp.]|uniref:DUF4164 family protein n=1 Tax=Phenylobacterium sp. TaxID=1871053 RepID=UPI0027350F89|nr:DUF4164 family protein [Phenylobacterium sp.]MDP3855447.1 DUF4164 family protein [Phenylobacterium sp.]